MNPSQRLIVALDLGNAADAAALRAKLAGAVGLFKVGSQLFTAEGPEPVRELVANSERVFLDLKYHDIPNTVAQAVAAACRLGVSMLTLHGLGGREMLKAAVAARQGDTRLLAITILTSHTRESLLGVGITTPLSEQVVRLALLAREAGVDGVVASPHEIGLVRAACGPDFLIVTPGIRPAGELAHDQARLATPGAALAAGADYVVVGRPILEASDPRAAAAAITREMNEVRPAV